MTRIGIIVTRRFALTCLSFAGLLLIAAYPALAKSDCKPAAPLTKSQCDKDSQCCAGLVCGPPIRSKNELPRQDPLPQCQPGCRIGGVFYASGTVNATQCQSCQPAVSTTAWSDLGNGTTCNDGNACTQTDTCQAGTCVGSNPVVCTASDQCHPAGTCNPSTGVCSNPAAANGTSCNDGNACTQTDACESGVCVGSNPVVCTASDQCHVAGTCNPSTGTCSNPPAASGTTCSGVPGAVCAAFTCNGGGACVGSYLSSSTQCLPPQGPCDVGAYCTGASATCPQVTYQPSTTLCSSETGPDGQYNCLDNVYCTGSSSACPDSGPDFIPSFSTNTPCHASTGPCDPVEYCGAYGYCNPDVLSTAGTDCSASVTSPAACDTYTCNGTDAACHDSGHKPSGTDCSASVAAAAACETYTCDGTDPTCNDSGPQPSTHICRYRGTNDCAINTNCDGTDSTCPAAEFYPDGTICTVLPEPRPDTNPAEHCLNNACVPIACVYSIDCPDGYVCDTSGDATSNQCVLAPTTNNAGGLVYNFGDKCTGESDNDHGTCVGYFCCAGMQTGSACNDGQGNGVYAAAGQPGRCAECCSEVTTSPLGNACGSQSLATDCCIGSTNGCSASCCGGHCTDVTGDPNNCGGCAYDQEGIDCNTLINACNPSVIGCEDSCVMADACPLDANGNPQLCSVPTKAVPNPACAYCSLSSEVIGAACSTDADCQGGGTYPDGTCVQIAGRCSNGAVCTTAADCPDDLFTFASGATGCSNLYCQNNNPLIETEPDCVTPPYTGCALACTAEPNGLTPVGTSCSTTSDCYPACPALTSIQAEFDQNYCLSCEPNCPPPSGENTAAGSAGENIWCVFTAGSSCQIGSSE